jgi:phospholipid/cholesterol/gamma-HCH transport system ATP-binding protein
MSETPKIRLRGVEKSFGPKRVLRGIDLDVPAGESTVVIGGSGTGKSVTIKCILGLIRADDGRIEVDGEDVTHVGGTRRDALLRRFGMLFQGSALFDSLPVWQNVAFGLIQGRGMKQDEAREIAIRKLAAVGLGPDVGELSPAELSGGMQKRVALARAIAADPEIIFFDEPTTGLDPIMADVINDLIKTCVHDLGATALSITHDMASVRKIADHVAMIHEGKIIWTGAAAEIDRSGDPYVDQFVHGRAEGPIQMQVRHI